jgi:hypothetical protein
LGVAFALPVVMSFMDWERRREMGPLFWLIC